MTTLRERVAGERRRLRSVRQALTAAVEEGARGDASFIPFYLAVADYIGESMDRLHAQDETMGKMLREKMAPSDVAAGETALGQLHERLAGNQEHLKALRAAQAALAAGEAGALERFETVSRAYTRYIVENMGHHGATTELAARLFTQADWERMANVSPEQASREQALHEKVFDLLPERMSGFVPAP